MRLFMNLSLAAWNLGFVFSSNLNVLAYEDWGTQIIDFFDSDDNNQNNKNVHEIRNNVTERLRIKIKNEVSPMAWF